MKIQALRFYVDALKCLSATTLYKHRNSTDESATNVFTCPSLATRHSNFFPSFQALRKLSYRAIPPGFTLFFFLINLILNLFYRTSNQLYHG